jgi:hypothetical protein
MRSEHVIREKNNFQNSKNFERKNILLQLPDKFSRKTVDIF